MDKQELESLRRPVVPELDEVLGVPMKVLDDGFVRVVDYMGSDESIVQAARVSYGAGTKKVTEDRGLIRYLMRHRHTTPFEMCEIKLHVRVPMDCWRQWIRHRTANV
ncbi:MAG: FAD-dependent thymidylate synthase, partial [Candidatus Krumholzibacteriota bacterium]|nr:FAD-dependent thymidylate synthase [Candidatus Krumholzibacteriota bacterium]